MKNDLPIGIDDKELEDLCINMLKKYGKDNQLNMVIQECSELIHSITKIKQLGEIGKTIYGEHGLTKEFADVWLMMKQLEIIYPYINENKYRVIRDAQKLLESD